MPAPALRVAVCLLAGACLASFVERLPDIRLAFAVLIVAAIVVRRSPALVVVAGFTVLVFDAQRTIDDRLAVSLVGSDITARVRILDFPVEGDVIRLVVAPLDAEQLPRIIRLSWYDAAELPQLGECWDLTMRLRRPRGFANPGRFDYEAWLLSRRVGATGYVRAGSRSEACTSADPVTRLRLRLSARLLARLPPGDATAILLAVTLGARQWIDRSQWDRFAATGTSHLMAISGMHVGLASGAVYLGVRMALGLVAAPVNQRIMAAVAAFGFAAVYAALSGFAIPARRALLMLGTAVAALAARRRAAGWQLLGLAGALILLCAPLDVLSAGFRLSFGAVFLLLALAARDRLSASPASQAPLGRRVADLARLQSALLFGLLPLTALMFGRLAWTAPLVNLVAVPVFGLLALPAALAGLAIDGAVGDWLLFLAWYAIRFVVALVNAAAALPAADLALPAPTGAVVIALAAAGLYAILPPGWPARLAGLLALPAVVFPGRYDPPADCADIDVLDVGQGLAVVVSTRRHTLVYDAGPSFRSGSDTGELVVRPFLDYRGRRRIDLLLVSHGDLDHAGGVASLVRDLDVRAILGDGVPGGVPCRAGQLWRWDGIGFAILNPVGNQEYSDNGASCVLEVRAGDSRVLLPGDIEARDERRISARGLLSPSDLVVMPHHGSKTSSNADFVQSLKPVFAVASVGHDNRWGMPASEIVARWQAVGAGVLSTAEHGALGFRLCAGSGVSLRYRHRVDSRRFWHED